MATLTAVSLFSGYDGIGLGLKFVVPSLRTICYVERQAYPVANLVAKIQAGKLDDAPIWSDIKTFDSAKWRGLVDILHGGYPCQGFSCAGKREGSRDPRFLWPWVYRGVVEMRPRIVFFENVEGHVSLGLSTVLSDLEEAGYRCAWGIFSAAEAGAPQRRKRVFLLGSESRNDACGRGMVDADCAGLQGWHSSSMPECSSERFVGSPNSLFWPGFVSRPGEQQHDWEPRRAIEIKRGLGGGVNGRAANVDRLRLLGNGVYPAVAAKAFVTLAAKLK